MKSKLYIAGPTTGKTTATGHFISKGLKVLDTDWLLELTNVFPEWIKDDLYQQSRRKDPKIGVLSDWKDVGSAFFVNIFRPDVIITNLWGRRFLMNLDPKMIELAAFVARDDAARIKELSDQRGSHITLETATHWVANYKEFAEKMGVVYLKNDEYLMNKILSSEEYDVEELEKLALSGKAKFIEEHNSIYTGQINLTGN